MAHKDQEVITINEELRAKQRWRKDVEERQEREAQWIAQEWQEARQECLQHYGTQETRHAMVHHALGQEAAAQCIITQQQKTAQLAMVPQELVAQQAMAQWDAEQCTMAQEVATQHAMVEAPAAQNAMAQEAVAQHAMMEMPAAQNIMAQEVDQHAIVQQELVPWQGAVAQQAMAQDAQLIMAHPMVAQHAMAQEAHLQHNRRRRNCNRALTHWTKSCRMRLAVVR